MVTRKFFPLDKNYLMKEAQAAQQKVLLNRMVEIVKEAYTQLHNPLGLECNTTRRIRKYTLQNPERLEEVYEAMSAIYRYKHVDNQLEFVWDGRSHQEIYAEEWAKVFCKWVWELCLRPNFLRAVLELTVFYPHGRKADLAENRMKAFISQHFALKMDKRKGRLVMMA